MKKRSVGLFCMLAIVIPACSSSPGTSAEGDRSRLGGKEDDKGARAGDGSSKKAIREKAAKVGEKAEGEGKGGGPGSGTSARVAGKPPGGSSIPSEVNPAFANRSATVPDSRTDAKKEGVTPSYAEVTKASIQGTGEDFVMTLTTDGQVPQKMPTPQTYYIIAFGITGNEDEGYSFGAQCTDKGWQAYAGGKDGKTGFPGTFVVEGNTIKMTIPWDYINGPRAFEWYAASNWFQQTGQITHYRVDLAPNEGTAKFPQ